MKIERKLLEEYINLLAKLTAKNDSAVNVSSKDLLERFPRATVYVLGSVIIDCIFFLRHTDQRGDVSKIIKALEALGVEVVE